MLVKYYLSDNIKASFEDFALGLRNAWAGPGYTDTNFWVFFFNIVIFIFFFTQFNNNFFFGQIHGFNLTHVGWVGLGWT